VRSGALASALHLGGVAATDIANALRSLYGDSDQAAAYWMNQAGVAANDITNALASAYQESVQTAQNWLSQAQGGLESLNPLNWL
jgi:hypothetical protein